MAGARKHLRSSTAHKRPTTAIEDGQIALNTNATSPGLFVKDSTGASILKIGPAHVGATAPNSAPAAGGSAGNSIGESWLDTSLTPVGDKVWDGTAWVNTTPASSTTVQGLVELATNAETQTGSDTARAVTPASLQSKVSDSTSTTSSTTIASSTAVKSAYDLANAALPATGGTVTGAVVVGSTGSIAFEGSTDDAFETALAVVDPTADRIITFPDRTGIVITTGDTGTVTSTMIADGTIVNADVNASAAIAGSKISPDFGGQNVVTTGSITGASLIPSSATVPTNGVYLPAANSVAISTSSLQRLAIDSSGRLLVGGMSSARANFLAGTATALVQIEKAGEGTAELSGVRNVSSTSGALLILGKSRSSAIGSVTTVINGDQMGCISFQGADGTNLVEGASIRGEVDGTPGANSMPGMLIFSTTADGASSPTSRIVIKEDGDIVMPATSAAKGFWIGTGDADGNNASANYRIGQNSVGIGSGTLYIGNAAIQVSSDARLKENIQDTTLSAVENLQKVRVVDFTWKDPTDTSYNNRNARGTWTGVIAQELIDVFPFAVNAPRKEDDLSIDHDSDSTWTVEQQQLVPVLIKAIQEQQAVIADLQSRVRVLETP